MDDSNTQDMAAFSTFESTRKGLRENQRRLLDEIWRQYLASPASDWPVANEFRAEFGRTPTLNALEDLPTGAVFTTFPTDRYALSLYGVFLTNEGARCFRMLVAFLEYLQTPAGGSRRVQRFTDVREALGLSDRESTILGRLIQLSWLRVGMSRMGPEWESGRPDNLDEIKELADVPGYVAENTIRCASEVAKQLRRNLGLPSIDPRAQPASDIPASVADQPGSPTLLDRWKKSAANHPVLASLGIIVAVIIAVGAVASAIRAVHELFPRPVSVADPVTYLSDTAWKASAHFDHRWRSLSFDDSAWHPARSPAPDQGSVTLGQSELRTMWGAVADTDSVVLFRRVVEVQDRDRIERATLLTVSDDDHRMWINQIAVVNDGDRAAGPLLTTDVTPVIHGGRNVLAIRATNAGGGKYLAIVLRIDFKK